MYLVVCDYIYKIYMQNIIVFILKFDISTNILRKLMTDLKFHNRFLTWMSFSVQLFTNKLYVGVTCDQLRCMTMNISSPYLNWCIQYINKQTTFSLIKEISSSTHFFLTKRHYQWLYCSTIDFPGDIVYWYDIQCSCFT